MQLTEEQLAIVAFATDRPENLIIEARAGAAKTTTLVHVAAALPQKKILCLSFNTRIREEMQEKLNAALPPSRHPDAKAANDPRYAVRAQTFNSLGLAAWNGFTRKWAKLNSSKLYHLYQAYLKTLSTDQRDLAYAEQDDILQALRWSKQFGWVPENYPGHWRPLCTDGEFFGGIEINLTDDQIAVVTQLAGESWKQTLEGIIDFDDQILAPAICSVSFPSYDIIMVDEAQDLSPINHAILKKIARGKRLIAVGDTCQAIYGFRGADENSIPSLRTLFGGETLYLTTCFRCATAIVAEASWRAPDMKPTTWAKPGAVFHHLIWDTDMILDSDVILCRFNAPLYSLAFRLIRDDRYPELVGNDVTKGLIAALRKLGKANIAVEIARDRLVGYEEEQAKKRKDRSSLRDRIECMRIFLQNGPTLGDAIIAANSLLERPGRIKLLTGHKAKGLEFPRVFILDREKIKLADDQNKNVLYVMQTRAAEELHYISMKDISDAA